MSRVAIYDATKKWSRIRTSEKHMFIYPFSVLITEFPHLFDIFVVWTAAHEMTRGTTKVHRIYTNDTCYKYNTLKYITVGDENNTFVVYFFLPLHVLFIVNTCRILGLFTAGIVVEGKKTSWQDLSSVGEQSENKWISSSEDLKWTIHPMMYNVYIFCAAF